MPTPRFHPFVRLVLFAIGALIVTLVVIGASMLIVGEALTSGQPGDSPKFLAITLITYPFVLLWMWYCRRVYDKRSFVSLGLRRAHADRDFLTGALCGVGTIAFLFGVLFLTGFIQLGASTGQIWSAEAIE